MMILSIVATVVLLGALFYHRVSLLLSDLPPELWAYLKEHRFFAMIIKKEYGGLEFSAYAQARVLQKLSGVSGILAITVGVPNSLGPGELLQHYGTEEQKNHYLPNPRQGYLRADRLHHRRPEHGRSGLAHAG